MNLKPPFSSREAKDACIARMFDETLTDKERKQARSELIERSLYIAHKLASPWPASRREDAFQSAATGIIMAADRLDPERPQAWFSFARLWAANQIREQMKPAQVSLPRDMNDRYIKMVRVMRQLQEDGRPVTTSAVAAAMNLDEDQIAPLIPFTRPGAFLAAHHVDVSEVRGADSPAGQPGSPVDQITYRETLAADRREEALAELAGGLREAVGYLPEPERAALLESMMDGQTTHHYRLHRARAMLAHPLLAKLWE